MPWIGSESLSGICQRANELDSAKRDYPLPDIVLLDDRFPVRVVAAVGAGHHPSSSRSHFATFSSRFPETCFRKVSKAKTWPPTTSKTERRESSGRSPERELKKKTWQVANNWGKVGSKEIFQKIRFCLLWRFAFVDVGDLELSIRDVMEGWLGSKPDSCDDDANFIVHQENEESVWLVFNEVGSFFSGINWQDKTHSVAALYSTELTN